MEPMPLKSSLCLRPPVMVMQGQTELDNEIQKASEIIGPRKYTVKELLTKR